MCFHSAKGFCVWNDHWTHASKLVRNLEWVNYEGRRKMGPGFSSTFFFNGFWDRILFSCKYPHSGWCHATRTEVMTVTEHRWGIHLSNHHCLPLSATHRPGAERVNQRDALAVRIVDKWRGQKETCEVLTASTSKMCPSCQGNFWQLLANSDNFATMAAFT